MPTAGDLRSVITKNVIFGALGSEEVDRLLAAATLRAYDKDQQIFQQGDLADGLYLVTSGRVGIRTLSEEGSEIFLNILEGGAVFGEIAAIDGGARTAGAIAMERSDLLFVDRRTFHGLMLASPALCVSLLTLMCERLRWTSSIIEDAHFRDVKTRLARRLHKLLGEYGVQQTDGGGMRIKLKVTQEMLARMLGATRESVNKELMALQRAGVLTYSRGYVTVHDREGLRAATTE
jgi:CRP/FNR family cyclic AMP-dependent transcriptional regulator